MCFLRLYLCLLVFVSTASCSGQESARGSATNSAETPNRPSPAASTVEPPSLKEKADVFGEQGLSPEHIMIIREAINKVLLGIESPSNETCPGGGTVSFTTSDENDDSAHDYIFDRCGLYAVFFTGSLRMEAVEPEEIWLHGQINVTGIIDTKCEIDTRVFGGKKPEGALCGVSHAEFFGDAPRNPDLYRW